MTHSLVIIRIALFLALFDPMMAHASGDGLSFFHRFVVMEDGKARFRSHRSKKEVPEGNRALLACKSLMWAKPNPCLKNALDVLESEFDAANEPDIKAGRAFIISLIHFQRMRLPQARAWVSKVLANARSPLLRGPALHWQMHIDLAQGQFDSLLAGFNALEHDLPNYTFLPYEFSTWSLNFCLYGEREWCQRPLYLKDFKRQKEQIVQSVVWNRTLEDAKASRSARAEALVGIGRTYEALCPSENFFAVVCYDALTFFNRAYPEFRDEPDVDYAFFQIQFSEFNYEYEGNEVAWAKDAVEIYGGFLEVYPNSTHAEKARANLKRGQEILRNARMTVK